VRINLRSCLAIFLCEALLFMPAWSYLAAQDSPPPSGLTQLDKELRKSYLTLFRISPSLHFSEAQISRMRELLDKGKSSCVGEFSHRADKYKSEIRHDEAHLRKISATITEGRRHNMHCEIQNLRFRRAQAEILAQHAIPIAYANKEAKLNLIQNWPSDLQRVKQAIASGAYRHRRWGNVQDIGSRTIVPGQQDDIRTGEEAVKEFKASGLMPPVLKDPTIANYVNTVAQQVALHSDLKVPLHVTVLNSKEINAFSFPGGYLFVERGLLGAVDDEAELAGIIGHEIGHVVARHGHRMMEKQEVAGIFLQAAAIAASVLTGGVGSIGAYLATSYALQYGFYGISLLLDLRLLGVSREFELQADQLGMQYAWNAGYDPSGFIRFFDKMATKEGYVNGVGWFYNHPPFYTRMLDAEREIMFLPKRAGLIVNTSKFRVMKKELAKVTAKSQEEAEKKPFVYEHEKGCTKPATLEYKSGEPIEQLCSSPKLTSGKIP
jgi:Zn-dependent protease with chaperone function